MESIERFAIVVVRCNGTDRELLRDTYATAAEAHQQAQHFAGYWQMVTLEVVGPFPVPIIGAPIALDADAFIKQKFPPKAAAKDRTSLMAFN